MGRFIVGGFSSGDVVFQIGDQICRPIQNAVLGRLSEGKGMFFRYAGTKESGAEMLTAIWIGPSAVLRFEYDADMLPDLDQQVAAGFKRQIDQAGGIVVPSAAEAATWDEYEEAVEADPTTE